MFIVDLIMDKIALKKRSKQLELNTAELHLIFTPSINELRDSYKDTANQLLAMIVASISTDKNPGKLPKRSEIENLKILKSNSCLRLC